MPARRPAGGERGFSLMEVATAIGVIAFALVALVGMFPLGLENSRRCVSETRATELLKMVVTTLQSEPFEAADCFATVHGKDGKPGKLNLNNFPSNTPSSSTAQGLAFPVAADVLLYASYDIREIPQVARLQASKKPEEALYRIELRFAKHLAPSAPPATPAPSSSSAAPTGGTPRVAGSIVDIRLCSADGKGVRIAETQAFVPNFSRSPYSADAP